MGLPKTHTIRRYLDACQKGGLLFALVSLAPIAALSMPSLFRGMALALGADPSLETIRMWYACAIGGGLAGLYSVAIGWSFDRALVKILGDA